ncbi:glycosyltransferase family 4 protein [uncultured Arthrobacter sp.]|uniref:glycosyltransferase family 4 protein n=1 Tax=uncultured Arthrobacter sp. TaxID=114050 RepID=UPI0025D1BD33|nr:glycosyltransferase family 4 protein [uncultured Arthrobacter sp.]
MRIGLIAGPWLPVPPEGYGGVELMVDSLARGLAEAGHEVLLAAPADSGCPVPLLPDTEVSDPSTLGITGSELPHVARAYAGLAEVDLIHDHTPTGPLYRHRPSRAAVIATIHNRLTPASRELYRAAAQDTALVAISRSQLSGSPDIRVAAVIHHGIDVARVPVGRGEGGYVCFLGRMCAEKGVVEAIRTARAAGLPLKIAAKMREAVELQYFRDAVEPILGPNEEFLGEVADGDKYALLGDAIALLNPIQWPEPFGLVTIEALATGTPVVATPLGALPEILDPGVTGYLADTPGALASLLARAAALDRAVIRARAEERFSAERMVDEHLALYLRTAAG